MSITLDDIVLARGSRDLVNRFSTVIASADRVGLFGPNGCGKTSLLLAICGELPLESGRIQFSPPKPTIGFLPQTRGLPSTWTIARALRERTGIAAADERLSAAADRLAVDTSPDACDDYELALQRFVALGGGTLDDRAPKVLHGLDANLDLDRSCTGLSGGELARVGLASLLLSRFDVLLLDEPTNDLDETGLALLTQFVLSRAEPMLVVSHDRRFLAETITQVIEFDPSLGSVVRFAGGYEAWRRERAATYRKVVEQNQRYADDVADLKRQVLEARQRSARGVRSARQAYTAGTTDKLQRGSMIEGATTEGSGARRAERQADRLQAPDQIRKVWQLRLNFPFFGGPGDAITFNHALIQAGAFELGPIDLAINSGQRLRIRGANGSGKSLLLSVLAGTTELKDGTISRSRGTRAGVLNQSRSLVPASATSLAEWFPEAAAISLEDARTLLAKFGLGGSAFLQPTDTLSPGERTRVGLAVLSARPTGVLILDEPTNHLDIPAIEQLETALREYAGTVIVATHDETFAVNARLDGSVDLDELRPT